MRPSVRLLCPALVFALPAVVRAQSTLGAPWDSVAAMLRAPGIATGGYYRYNLPRRDITLRIGDVTVSPALALGGWVGMSAAPGGEADAMGDLVLLAAELKPVLAELAARGCPRWRTAAPSTSSW
jgi:hypothetical protein